NGSVLSRTEFFYDDETFSGGNLGSVTIGNLTLRREWSNAANAGDYIASARTRYDPYGNPKVLLDPLASASTDPSSGHVREILYDPAFYTYPITETIYLGSTKPSLVFHAHYDKGFGTVIGSVDFNGNSTSYTYDVFARLINIVRPGDTPDLPTIEY